MKERETLRSPILARDLFGRKKTQLPGTEKGGREWDTLSGPREQRKGRRRGKSFWEVNDGKG